MMPFVRIHYFEQSKYVLGLGGLESYFNRLEEITKLKEELIQLESYEYDAEIGHFIPVDSIETNTSDDKYVANITENSSNVLSTTSIATITSKELIMNERNSNTEVEKVTEIIPSEYQTQPTTENSSSLEKNFEDNETEANQERNYSASEQTTDTPDYSTDSFNSFTSLISNTLSSNLTLVDNSSEALTANGTDKIISSEVVIDSPRHKKTLSNSDSLPRESETLPTLPRVSHIMLSKNQMNPLRVVPQDDIELVQALPLVAASFDSVTGRLS